MGDPESGRSFFARAQIPGRASALSVTFLGIGFSKNSCGWPLKAIIRGSELGLGLAGNSRGRTEGVCHVGIWRLSTMQAGHFT